MKKKGPAKRRSKKYKAKLRGNSKKAGQKRHARKRALQRHEINLSQEDFAKIKTLVNSGKSELLERQSHRISIRKITLNNEDYVIIYDHNRQTVVTFLPKDNRYTRLTIANQQPIIPPT